MAGRIVMNKKKQKQIEEAKDSLGEILKRIAPYVPKTPKVKPKPKRQWKLSAQGELPPINSTGNT